MFSHDMRHFFSSIPQASTHLCVGKVKVNWISQARPVIAEAKLLAAHITICCPVQGEIKIRVFVLDTQLSHATGWAVHLLP